MRALVVAIALVLPAAAAAADGGQLYGRYCASCHGPGGAGIAGAGPSVRGAGAQAADFYLRTGYMPLRHEGQPRRSRQLLSEPQVGALVRFVAGLGRGPGIPAPRPERGSLSAGQRLFTERCSGCHQITGEGGYVTGALPPPLGEATATQIAEAVRIGPYVMPRFSKRALTDAQLDSVVRYVLWARSPDDRGGWSLGHVGPVPEGLVTWFLAAAVLVATCMLVGSRLRG